MGGGERNVLMSELKVEPVAHYGGLEVGEVRSVADEPR